MSYLVILKSIKFNYYIFKMYRTYKYEKIMEVEEVEI